MKGLLLLSNRIKTVKSDRLFYDRFEYCFVFHQDEAGSLRKLTHQYVSSALALRRTWAKMRHRGTNPYGPYTIGSLDAELENCLHEMCDFLLAIEPEHKIVIVCNEIRIYLNSMELIKSWASKEQFKSAQVSQAVVVRPKNTIALKNPKHSYRAYFHTAHFTDVEKTTLRNFLNSQKDQIRTGPALTNWLYNKWLWSMDTFFVDYDNEQWLLMLAIVHPGLIRKTMAIVQAK